MSTAQQELLAESIQSDASFKMWKLYKKQTNKCKQIKRENKLLGLLACQLLNKKSWQNLIRRWPELRNVNSFTQSKNLELNFTPRKTRKLQQFWDLSETKLTKTIVLDNK